MSRATFADLAGTRRSPGWRAVLDRAAFGAAAVLLALETVPHLSAWSTLDAQPGDQRLLLIAILMRLALLAVVATLAVIGPRRVLGAAALVLAGAGFVAAAMITWPDTERAAEASMMVPLWALQALELTLLATAGTLSRGLALVALTFPAWLLIRLPAGLSADDPGIWVGGSGGALAIGALVAWLRQGAGYADRLEADRERLRELTAARAVQARSDGETRRLIHDEVLTALTAVGTLGDGTLTRQACRTALQAVERRPLPATGAGLMALLEEHPELEVRTEGSWTTAPPASVMAGFAAAAGEALRNVQRHSGATAAQIRLVETGNQLELLVVDRGRGVQGSGVGFGIRQSITQRMCEVGGRAEVHTGTGGTSVRLRWTAPVAAPSAHALVTRHAERGYLLAVAPMVAANAYLALTQPTESRVANVLVATAMALAVVASVRLVPRPARWRDMALLTALACALGGAGLAFTPPGALMGLATWPIALAPMLVAAPAIEAPGRTAVLPAVALVGLVGAGAWTDPTLTVAQPTASYLSALLPLVFCFGLGALVRAGSRRIRVREAILAARREEEAWQRATDRARARVRARLDGRTGALLRRVADGGELDAATMAEARRLAPRLRDELHLDSPLAPALRDAVDGARATGALVGIRRPGSTDPATEETLGRALTWVLAHHRPDVVTVFCGPEPRLVVLPPLGPVPAQRLQGDMPTAVVADDEVRTILRP